MGRLLLLFLGLAGLVALGCAVQQGEKEWMRESDIAFVDCHVSDYKALLDTKRKEGKSLTGINSPTTLLALALTDCPIPTARGYKSYAEYLACKEQGILLYRQRYGDLTGEAIQAIEDSMASTRNSAVCHTEGNPQDLPGAPIIPTSTPVPPTNTPLPTPTPTTVPMPTQVLSYKRIAEEYPFTIKVPADWSATVQDTDFSTEYHYIAPNNDFALIIIAISESEIGFPFDSEEFANISLREAENRAAEGTFELQERTTMPSGAVRFSSSYDVWPCHVNAVALVQVLQETAFAVEGLACRDKWDEYGHVLDEAIASFAFKP